MAGAEDGRWEVGCEGTQVQLGAGGEREGMKGLSCFQLSLDNTERTRVYVWVCVWEVVEKNTGESVAKLLGFCCSQRACSLGAKMACSKKMSSEQSGENIHKSVLMWCPGTRMGGRTREGNEHHPAAFSCLAGVISGVSAPGTPPA